MIDDVLIDRITEILGYELWAEIGAFGESIDNALKLPIDTDMWWVINTPLNPIFKPRAELHKGVGWNEDHEYWWDDITVADKPGKTIIEAICLAWAAWKEDGQS